MLETGFPGLIEYDPAGYFKALGLFRIVSEQADRKARSWWADARFHISSALEADELVRFLLHEYRPTPVIQPGITGSKSSQSLLGKGALPQKVISLAAEDPRLEPYARDLERAATVISQRKPRDRWESLALLRNALSDSAVAWLDACAVLEPRPPGAPRGRAGRGSSGVSISPITFGAADNRGNWVAYYLNAIVALFDSKLTAAVKEELLRASLFGSPITSKRGDALCKKRSAPSFFVGSMEFGRAAFPEEEGDAGKKSNPWDVVLSLEGVPLFAGLGVRTQRSGRKLAAFPFVTPYRPKDSGEQAYTDARGDKVPKRAVWLPYWENPCSYAGLRRTMAEGMAGLRRGRRTVQAVSSSEFAAAIARLGTARGLTGFQCVPMLQRSGRMRVHVAGDFLPVKHEVGSRPAELLAEASLMLRRLDRVLDSDGDRQLHLRRMQVEEGIVRATQALSPERFQAVLVGLGRINRRLGVLSEADPTNVPQPLWGLSTGWAFAADDASHEYRIALALASLKEVVNADLGEAEQVALPPGLVGYLLPVIMAGQGLNWASPTSTVWGARSLVDNLAEVLRRRVLEAGQAQMRWPPIDPRYGVGASRLSAFYHGLVDEQRVEDLIFGLCLVDWRRQRPKLVESPSSVPGSGPQTFLPIPPSLEFVRLLMVPESQSAVRAPFCAAPVQENAWAAWMGEPMGVLLSGDLSRAGALAVRRLAAYGYPVFVPLWESLPAGENLGRRGAASALIPLSAAALRRMAWRTFRRDVDQEIG